MLTSRGVTVAATGLAMWVAARLLGSPALEVTGIGLGVLPFLASFSMRLAPRRVDVRRSLSEARVGPGTRVTVELEVDNRSVTSSPVLLLEDRVPPALGRPARLVLIDVRGRSRRLVSYTLLPHARGRYRIGPLTIDATDPFGLTRRRARDERVDELLVTPEIEELATPMDAASSASVGSARARQLLRTGEEYFTMRAYQDGDDLRRIHWPSVARTGSLMIRQDESSRRAGGLVFLDNRDTTLGDAQSPAFERAVSCAASVGMLLLRNGFTVRVATAGTPAVPLAEGRFLELLAGIEPWRAPSLSASLTPLRAAASPDTSLVFVAAPPAPQELPGLIRAGAGFGPRLAILVHPADPQTVPESRRTQLEGRATQAALTLGRAGWDCLVLAPSTKLVDRWHAPRERRLASNA